MKPPVVTSTSPRAKLSAVPSFSREGRRVTTAGQEPERTSRPLASESLCTRPSGAAAYR
jgi:hypothetical protein